MKRTCILLAVAGATLAVPAFADTLTYTTPAHRVTTYEYDPVNRIYVERSSIVYDDGTLPAPAVAAPPPVTTSSAPVTTYTDTTPEPVTYVSPPVVVEAPRRTEDQLINDEVVDRIASDPRISGQVGVETWRSNVTLSGRVGTQRQVEIAERDARSVSGVREVNNALRARVGSF